jgi:hypothetical protein
VRFLILATKIFQDQHRIQESSIGKPGGILVHAFSCLWCACAFSGLNFVTKSSEQSFCSQVLRVRNVPPGNEQGGRKVARKYYIPKPASMAEDDEMGNVPKPTLRQECP